ncbi:MAG: hypothetical protein JHD16_09480 [Solirubrobacteraceae bacterium]|nr:hypothetical protein [Solirubrobacteraceae bacterium]
MVAGVLLACAWQASSAAALTPPAACGGTTQITDAAGDGHHANTDIRAGWFTLASGRLQAVIGVSTASWRPAHDDSAAAGYAMAFTLGGQVRYVRLQTSPDGGAAFDHGTWTPAGGFASVGSTTGTLSPTGPDGWVAIDVPTDIGAVSGATLSTPFVLTYDGQEASGEPHWVDRAPGGTTPTDAAVGADYTVLPCAPGPLAPVGPTGPGSGASAGVVTGVSLVAPQRITGSRTVTVRGGITPAVAGVEVTVTKVTPSRTVVRTITTGDGGAFALRTPIGERLTLRATAGGVGSQTLPVDVRARVRIAVRRTRSGGAVITGRVSPNLPGRVLWLRTDAVSPSATTRPRRGAFTLRLRHPSKGRYQALFIPSKERAERALSNTGIIK